MTDQTTEVVDGQQEADETIEVAGVTLIPMRKASGGYVSAFAGAFASIYTRLTITLDPETPEDEPVSMLIFSALPEDKEDVIPIPTHQLRMLQALVYATLTGKGDTPEGMSIWVSQVDPEHWASIEKMNPLITVIPKRGGRNGASGFELRANDALAVARIRGPIFADSVVKYPAVLETRKASTKKQPAVEKVEFSF